MGPLRQQVVFLSFPERTQSAQELGDWDEGALRQISEHTIGSRIITVRAEITTELMPIRAGPVIF